MAFNEFPIPTQRLDLKDVVSSLGMSEHVIVVTGDGVRQITKGNLGFTRVFVQSSTPSGTLTTRDLWIRTTDNLLHTWSGSGWVARSQVGAGSIPLTAIESIDQSAILGRNDIDGSGSPTQLTAEQVRTILNVANGANAYTHPNHSGDVTSAGDGATTIAADAVTNTKLANMAANTLKARSSATAGDPQDVAIAANRFPARGSTGQLEAKIISDLGLSLVSLDNVQAILDLLGIEWTAASGNVFVLSEADLPDPVANVIQLEDDTTYWIIGEISLNGNTIQKGTNTSIMDPRGLSAQMYFNGNATETTITTQGEWVKIGIATTGVALNGFEHTSPNTLEYTRAYPKHTRVILSAWVSPSNPNDNCEVAVFRNGSLLDNLTKEIELDGDEKGYAISGYVPSLTNGDELEVYIRNTSGTGNLTVRSMSLTV